MKILGFPMNVLVEFVVFSMEYDIWALPPSVGELRLVVYRIASLRQVALRMSLSASSRAWQNCKAYIYINIILYTRQANTICKYPLLYQSISIWIATGKIGPAQ